MMKDILVNLSTAPTTDVAGEFAVSIAPQFDAHLAGVSFVYDPVPADITIATVPADVLEGLRRENEAAAKSVIAKVARLTDRAGVSAEWHTMNATFVGAAESFARMARRFGLSIIGQPEPNRLAPEELMIEGALFASGRPVIVVPYIQKSGLRLDRVMVCWDGSHHAARALADSMPFLARANAIEVLMIANEPAKSDEIPGADIAHHLARHRLNVEVRRMSSPGVDVANAILSRAADTEADLIVMGGYGHSRVREFILGGATRGILSDMTVPTFMSH